MMVGGEGEEKVVEKVGFVEEVWEDSSGGQMVVWVSKVWILCR